MTTQTYRQLILEGIRDLPADALAEIVDFVLFLRKRTFDREAFDREMQSVFFKRGIIRAKPGRAVSSREGDGKLTIWV